MFHVRHALPLDGAGNNRSRLAFAGAGGGKSRLDLIKIVCVAGDDVPAEGTELLVVRRGVHYVGHGAVDLQTVPVHDGDQIIKTVVCGKHRRLPDLPFLALTVTDGGINAEIFLQVLRGQRHAAGSGNAEPQ